MLLPIAVIALVFLQSPDPTLPPANAHLVATAVGLGVQVYRCTAPADAPKNFQWTLEAPEATLFDPSTHQPLGTHSAGPKWTWKDGSEILGNVVQKRSADVAGSVPWLLLETHPSTKSGGALDGVTFVRRSDTQAGAAPPTGCDEVHQNIVLRVPYQATYTFYTTSR